jgi:hypothetical protein
MEVTMKQNLFTGELNTAVENIKSCEEDIETLCKSDKFHAKPYQDLKKLIHLSCHLVIRMGLTRRRK